MSPEPRPTLSVVVPVLDEAPCLVDLHDRLARTLKDIGQPYEIIFVDDGSRDGSAGILRGLHARDGAVKVVRFNRNYGQHAAVLAGMVQARGDVVVTLDADLQNPPEEIPRLLAALTDGVDVAGGWRAARRDPWARRAASWAANRLTSAIVGVRLRDYGCMLRAYRRSVVDQIVACPGVAQFIPALGASFATGVAEIPVAHEAREHGRSRYGLRRLLRLGLHILALGLIGEYVGRLYQEVRRRPRYVISEVLE